MLYAVCQYAALNTGQSGSWHWTVAVNTKSKSNCWKSCNKIKQSTTSESQLTYADWQIATRSEIWNSHIKTLCQSTELSNSSAAVQLCSSVHQSHMMSNLALAGKKTCAVFTRQEMDRVRSLSPSVTRCTLVGLTQFPFPCFKLHSPPPSHNLTPSTDTQNAILPKQLLLQHLPRSSTAAFCPLTLS